MPDNRNRTDGPGRLARLARRLAVPLLAVLCALGVALPAQADIDGSLRDLPGAQGFRIGTAVDPNRLNNEADYRNTTIEQFNSITAENVMKWETIQPSRGQFNWSGADQVVNFAQANDQIVYGHTMIWHSQLPSWVRDGGMSATQLRTVMQEHIAALGGRYRGEIYAWDVVNEAFNEDGTFRDSVFYRTLGESYIADALRWADQADPNARLYINDYNVEGINAKSDGLYNLARRLLQQGVPLDGIGMQAHLIGGQVPSTMQQNIQRFADLGLEVTITELDIRVPTPASNASIQQQGNDYRAVMNACLNVSACTGVTVWGVTDRYSWVPDTFPGQGAALPIDENYNAKPAYWAMYEALGGEDPGPGPGPDPVGGCTVTYATTSSWNNGATANVTVRNNGTAPINGWSVVWSFPSGQRVTSAWNASATQNGTQVTATNASWNQTIAAGSSVSFGFQLSHSGTNTAPSAFTLNGTACTT
ncbi:endo-1,4-beta-xylanase [Allonocardiopsis opalescens]|uniref:Beta-xylanase n=1 Tax=Allonocardiopsis opalescens TaxID=1144618 RepID=A0A2T0QD20_9ACTN|nr:endo-1,4-beta-xylanase [Allonocardiopsis opalescens]PRY01798.1 endo-1,4-beta-xylanase (glycosyl hydrolase family 10) [Allonocardiopsis opalescens]